VKLGAPRGHLVRQSADDARLGGAVVLSVSNPSKVDVSIFSIEKSNDGKNFMLLEMVSNIGKGDKSMTYTDSNVSSDLTYYRVKAISSTGNETVLPVATVKGI